MTEHAEPILTLIRDRFTHIESRMDSDKNDASESRRRFMKSSSNMAIC